MRELNAVCPDVEIPRAAVRSALGFHIYSPNPFDRDGPHLKAFATQNLPTIEVQWRLAESIFRDINGHWESAVGR